MGVWQINNLLIVLSVLCIPIMQGEEQSHCPSLAENPICPCFSYKEGLFLECPSATPNAVKSILSKIKGTIQSLSIYDLDVSTTEFKADIFSQNTKIINLQISQSNIRTINPYAFTTLRESLTSLSIVSSNLNKVPIDSLVDLKNMEILDLQLNGIEKIQENDFSKLRLKKLNLKGNKITSIAENALTSLEISLTELDLTENFLESFPLKCLRKLNKLEILRVSWNKISTIPTHTDVKINALTSLDLSSNLLTVIENDFFLSMPNIKVLVLFSNRIRDVNSKAFSYLKSLESLDLSHNQIITLSQDIFQLNYNLKTIDLSHNHLHHVKGVFSNLYRISEIFISENNILEITDNDFKNSSGLNVLNLENNAIRSIGTSSFSFLVNLTQLHVGTNFLKKLPETVFENNINLVTLSLDSNKIDDLSEFVFKKLVNLKELRLQNNRLIHIKRNVFSPLPALLELHLQNNVIRNIDSHSFITLKNLQHINLQGNRLATVGDIFPNRNSSLVSIQLAVNNLSLLKSTSLRGQTNVQIMWLSQNNIEVLSNNLFNDLINIQRLYLKRNNIVKIENKAFVELKKIKYLDISKNKLTTLTNESFFELATLEELYLNHNDLYAIAEDTFKYLQKLKILDLSMNKIKEFNFDMTKCPIKILRINHNLVSGINASYVKTITNLNELEIKNNSITWEDITQIQIPGLKVLHVSSNLFADIDSKTFSLLPSIQTLTLEFANISSLPPTIFNKNQNLLRINLAHNLIKEIHKDVFAYTTILQDLSLRANHFIEFPHLALFNITSLEVLDLCENQMQSIDLFKFIGLQNLRTLSLCQNKISMFNGFNFPSLKNLVSLNLSNNMLTVLPPNFFQHSVGLKEIDLSFNYFKYLPSNGFSEALLPSLKILNLTSNPMIQLLQTYPAKENLLLEELIVSDTNLTIITSKDFENFSALKKLSLNRNHIERLSPGPFTKLNNLDTLDLSQNKLENIPRERLQGLFALRVLNISQNVIKELEEFTTDLKNLQKLDLSINHITRITKDVFYGLQSLIELNLSGNWLSYVSADAFRNVNKVVHIDLSRNYFEVIQMRMLLSLETQIKSLSFDENPLSCNCDAQDLWRWMQDHYKLVLKGSANLRCEHPDDLHGYSFLELTSQKLCDIPIIVRIAIQDIQTYSVVVTWHSRNQTGLSGYQVAYFGESNPTTVRGKTVNATSRFVRLSHLTPGAKYTICVIALGEFSISSDKSSSIAPGARIANVPDTTSSLYGDEQIFDHTQTQMNNSQISKCTTVNTIEIFGSTFESSFSNSYMGIADILTRRLSLVVGCCMGFIVFVVLIIALGYFKSKKRPVLAKTDVQTVAPPYVSYDNFTSPELLDDGETLTINTISDKTKQ